MTDLRKAAEMALETLERLNRWLGLRYGNELTPPEREVVKALRKALSQPEQKPYGWISNEDGWFRKHEIADLAFKAGAIPLYTAPPKCEWVEITKGECDELFKSASDHVEYAYAIEAKLKEKNT